MILGIIILVLSLILNIVLLFRNKKQVELDEITEKKNKALREGNEILLQEKDEYQEQVFNLINKRKTEEYLLQATKESLQSSKEKLEEFQLSLEKEYINANKQHEEKLKFIKDSYSEKSALISQEVEQLKKELESLKRTKEAQIEAARKEQLIKEEPEKYSLQLSPAIKNDIRTLEKIKTDLNEPRILSMLIWQTYYQKSLKTLFATIIGSSVVTGIYKITNLQTSECYIGQSVDIGKRWIEHAKCGLDIDRPLGNKLYNAMQEYGLYNFSWEILEECSKEELNSLEKYYIDFYNSVNYGYNSQLGNK